MQDHPNIIKFYGYYFTETMYNAFRLCIITEFMDHHMNLENVYRKRKKANQYWKEKELVTMYCSIISTCAFLQNRGICHRDIKPANLFLLPSNELKLIDFGESKDYVYDLEDEEKNTYTMATIRGTPQYLSPILWKAHVIDGQSRYAEHNIYKSDVFSTGLVLFQLGSMNEVSGFNAKTSTSNGEELIKENMRALSKLYSPQYLQILDILLRFEESERPSFSEIEQLFLEKEATSKNCNEYIKFYNQNYNSLVKMNSTFKSGTLPLQPSSSLREPLQPQTSSGSFRAQEEKQDEEKEPPLADSSKAVRKPSSSAGNLYKDSTLIVNDSCYWFEFGGCAIGRFSINKLKWKIDNGNESKRFPLHFSVLFIPESKSYFLLGGPPDENFRIFSNRKLSFSNCQMPTFRNFFSTVYHNQRVYVFGGYECNLKAQLRSCEYFDTAASKWTPITSLKAARSQSAACRINDQHILVFGGYNKEGGTLDTIERYVIDENRFEGLSLRLPIPLRRFMVVRITKNVALVLGGLTKSSKESQRVFKLDYERMSFVELENLEKGGAIENEVLVDSDGSLHIFLEDASGTSPHSHIKYSYDPNDEKYATRNDV